MFSLFWTIAASFHVILSNIQMGGEANSDVSTQVLCIVQLNNQHQIMLFGI